MTYSTLVLALIVGALFGLQTPTAYAATSPVCLPYIKQYNALGSRGSEVVKLQQILNRYNGENITVTGYYGRNTEAAVKRFQHKYGIIASGKQLILTTTRINALHCGFGSQNMGFPPVEKKPAPVVCQAYIQQHATVGTRSRDVARLQTFLNVYYDAQIPVTGYFGAITESAVRQFQSEYGIIPASGKQLKKTTAKVNQLYCTFGGVSPVIDSMPSVLYTNVSSQPQKPQKTSTTMPAMRKIVTNDSNSKTKKVATGTVTKLKMGDMWSAFDGGVINRAWGRNGSASPNMPLRSALLGLAILIAGLIVIRWFWMILMQAHTNDHAQLPLILPPAQKDIVVRADVKDKATESNTDKTINS